MTELFGRLAPGVDLDGPASSCARPTRPCQRVSRGVSDAGRLPDRRGAAPRPVHLARPNRPAGAVRRLGAGFRDRLLECRQSDPRAIGAPRRELALRAAFGAEPARCGGRCCESLVLCGAGAALASASRGRWSRCCRGMPRASRSARSNSLSTPLAVGRRRPGVSPPCCWPRSPAAVLRASNGFGLASGSLRITGGTTPLRLFAVTQIGASFVLIAGAGMLLKTFLALQARRPVYTCNVLAVNVPVTTSGRPPESRTLYRKRSGASTRCPGSSRWRRHGGAWREAGLLRGAVHGGRIREGRRRRGSAGAFPLRLARIFRRAGRADSRRPRFHDDDRGDGEQVVIVSQSLAQRLFPTRTRSTASCCGPIR